MQTSRTRAFLWLTLLSLLACHGPALGNTPVPEDVLVTANRLNENALALPLAWSTVDSEALALVDAIHINEIMQRVPGAWISRGNGQESLISLRSPVLTGAGGCGAFLTAADGISLRAPGFCNINQLFDANFEQAGRIEVLRGPSTALFGSNAMHGVINVMSAAPSTQLDNRLSVEGGPYEYLRGKYRYSDTVGRHGISFNANATHDGGYKKSSGYDQQKVTLRHDYDGSKWNIRSVLDGANLDQDTAGYIQGFNAYKDGDIKRENPNPEAYRKPWSLRFYTAASTSLDDKNALVITPYVRANEMKFLMHFLPWQPTEKNDHSSIGLRAHINTDADSLRWINGVDFEYTDASLKETQQEPFSPNMPAGIHYDYTVDATVAAAYSQIRTQFDSNWELDGGIRVEYTKYDYDNHATDGSACGPDADNCRFYRPADRDDDFTEWSFNAGASYNLHEDHVTYLRIARGYRAPQAAELYRLQSGQQSADLDPEKLDNIEIGFRGYWQDRLRYDLAAYYMRKDDVIFQDADRQNVSGAKTRHYGVEMGLNYQISRHWSAAIDANVASHTYDSRVMLLGGGSSDIKGNDIDTSPNIFGSARLDWDLSAIAGRPSRAELEWVYMDSYYLEPQNEHRYNGHSLFNLRITTDVTTRLSAGLRITNLLDEDYAERADFGFGNYRYFVGQPRGAYVQLNYQFGDI